MYAPGRGGVVSRECDRISQKNNRMCLHTCPALDAVCGACRVPAEARAAGGAARAPACSLGHLDLRPSRQRPGPWRRPPKKQAPVWARVSFTWTRVESPPPHITETPVRHPQGRYQASSRDLGVSQPPQGVDQLTHPLDTAGEAVSGDPALRRAQTRQSALNLGEY